MVSATRPVREPGLIRPGQTAHVGTRSPPSYIVPLPSRTGPLSAPTPVWPPLSLLKITSVLSARPASFSAASTWPMP